MTTKPKQGNLYAILILGLAAILSITLADIAVGGPTVKGAKQKMTNEPSKGAAHLAVYSQKDDDKERAKGLAVGYFAAGCFWGVEDYFKSIKGVTDTTVGYMGGRTENPTYKDVCGDDTGHAEAVRVVFDPKVLSYDTLVHEFFELHDPTTMNRQGPDVGAQYRSAIFFTDAAEKEKASHLISKEQATPAFSGKKIVTKLEPLTKFYSAEDYHQDYFTKNPGRGCHVKRHN